MDIQNIHNQLDRLDEISESLEFISYTVSKEPKEYAGLYWIISSLAKQVKESSSHITNSLKSG